MKKISPNDPCPCGSGKKFKKCCSGKDVQWEQSPDGTLVKSVPMNEELLEIFNQQQEKFVKQFGREPGPEDQIFFDAPPFEHVEHALVQAMKSANISPSIIYAFEKTGLLVTEENQNKIATSDLKRWTEAIQEYEARHDDDLPF
jgi:SEC-C motif